MNFSGIYLIKVGNFKDLKHIFLADKDYDGDDYFIYKFGYSKNINDRFKTHQRHFGYLGCNINIDYNKQINCDDLLYYENKVKLMLSCENHCEEFIFKDNKGNRYNELVIIKSENLDKVKIFYDNLDNREFVKEYFSNNIINESKHKHKINTVNILKRETPVNKINPCEICIESDSPCINCINCINKEKVSKKYLCKHCGESDSSKFYDNRYTSCKVCRNSAKKLCADHKNLETKEPKCFKDNFNSFIYNDTDLFQGFSIYEILVKIKSEQKKSEKEYNNLLNICNNVFELQKETSRDIGSYIEENRRLKEENKEIKDRLKFLENVKLRINFKRWKKINKFNLKKITREKIKI